MELEEAFLEADGDKDKALTLAEFKGGAQPVLQAIAGRSVVPVSAAAGAHLPRAGWNGRLLALIGLNVLVFAGLGVWQYRR
jgi:hypothetical protein